jgi:hypothetical protein
MKIIATLPPPHHVAVGEVANNPLVEEVRFNVGMRTPYDEYEALSRMLKIVGDKKLWLDLKGRQLRIEQWAVPTYGDIVLNHEIEVDLPATIWFRGNEKSQIVAVKGRRIYVDPAPPKAVGAGQAVNVHGKNLKVKGYLTDEDERYLYAASKLGIKNFMLSFVESSDDIRSVSDSYPTDHVVAKLESPLGIKWLKDFKKDPHITLMAARDDLYINTPEPKHTIMSDLAQIIKKDPDAIVASRILESLDVDDYPALSEVSDVLLMILMGYKQFMFGDRICLNKDKFSKAVSALAWIPTQARIFKHG